MIINLIYDPQPTYEIVYKNFRVADDDALRGYSLKGNFAFGMERLITGNYKNKIK